MHPAWRRVRRSVRPGKDRERAFFFHRRISPKSRCARPAPREESVLPGQKQEERRNLAKNVQPQEECAV